MLQHLNFPGTYARMLFVYFSSAFNTIIPEVLFTKLTQLTVPASTCQWITNFLTDRKQQVRLGEITSSTRTVSSGATQGCVLSPLLFSLSTNDCSSGHPSVQLLKFADDTTIIGLIRDGDESAYRREVDQLALWCSRYNLELNSLKTVEMIVDFRRSPPSLPPPHYTEQYCVCCGILQVSGFHNLPELEVGVKHQNLHQKGPAEDVLPAPAQEEQPASGAADPVLHCSHWASFTKCSYEQMCSQTPLTQF